ncbi:selenide, water dikinase SelD [Rhodobacterales bacterium HKCCE3408]|nr:selenide, water dikinase SelD [Rhodobacterales bacterium HKCCE3408]
MRRPLPLTRDLVLVGGGHAHALVLRRWGMRPVPGARLTLIHPGPTAPYTGMLPGHVAGHYSRDQLMIDMVRLARFAGARLILGEAEEIDRRAGEVRIPGRGAIGYDLLSIDIGVTSAMPDVPGFAEHGVPAKPLDTFADRWDAFAEAPPDQPKIVVVGGGVAGVELAMAAQHRLGASAAVTVVEREKLLSVLPHRARHGLTAELRAAGITTLEGTGVAKIAADHVDLTDGRSLPADLVVGAAGARPHAWLAATGLDTKDGYLVVDEQLRTSDPAIYAAGDCAHFAADPRPKAGVYAVRAAPILAWNLAADLTGRQRRSFRPQRDYLKLVSLGRKAALGEKSGIVLRGDWVWRWKDRIDRRFMDKLNDLPAMPGEPAPRDAAKGVAAELSGPMPCGGCGAKVGPAALAEAVARLAGGSRADVIARAGDDAAVLAVGGAKQVVTTDHLRAFAEDPALVARVAALHAMGDVWAMGAQPQAVLAQVILPPMTDRLQRRWLAEIMSAAGDAVAEAGAEIVGGHTTQGSELTIGFTVTGLLDRDPLLLSGARPGDALLLTRPIGSGVLLAAEMAGKARGADIARLWEIMATSQARVALALSGHASAMTDVTGFGLAGHLLGMCSASGLSAEIDLGAVPVLDGALALAEAGIASTLVPANAQAAAGRVIGGAGARLDLLHDPQTAGGFLAAVPDKLAQTAVQATDGAAVRIGRLTDGPPVITIR